MVDSEAEAELFLEKAGEALAGAESEFANGRYNNCANRCYYACFQAAIAALTRVGTGRSVAPDSSWKRSRRREVKEDEC